LLTNDDGVFADGMAVVRQTLAQCWEVVVVAPDREQSAAGHALTLHHPLRVRQIDELTYSVDGTPTDCVMLAMHGLLDRKPDFVVAGINHGPNLGDDVTYSGTVAAAMEGTLLGLPSVAVSVTEWENLHFSAAATFVRRLVQAVLENGMPPDTFLNVNVPNLPRGQIKGATITRLGRRVYRDAVLKRDDPRGRPYYWIGGQDPTWVGGERTDFAAIEAGMISVTPLHFDLTNHKALSELERWELDSW
jgi:5'-nucleotidase